MLSPSIPEKERFSQAMNRRFLQFAPISYVSPQNPCIFDPIYQIVCKNALSGLRFSARELRVLDTQRRSRKNKRAPKPMRTLPVSQRSTEAKRGCVASFSPKLPERKAYAA